MLFSLVREGRTVQVTGDLFLLNPRPGDKVFAAETIEELIGAENSSEASYDNFEAPSQEIKAQNNNRGYLIYQ